MTKPSDKALEALAKSGETKAAAAKMQRILDAREWSQKIEAVRDEDISVREATRQVLVAGITDRKESSVSACIRQFRAATETQDSVFALEEAAETVRYWKLMQRLKACGPGARATYMLKWTNDKLERAVDSIEQIKPWPLTEPGEVPEPPPD